jgi:hypothetical protein
VAYAVVGTVGVPSNMGRVWGPQGVKDAIAANKKTDQSRESSEILNNAKFLAMVERYEGQMTDDEKHQLKVIVKGYFDNNPGGKVSLVKHATGKTLKRIEILGPPDDWVTIWSEA